jgi:HK97 family phage major capsid protein
MRRTLVRYTKKIQLSWELMEDEDSKLMAFIENFIGRGLAKTHNNLLLTEVAANGTSLKTFASATAIAVDELEPVVYNDDLGDYLDEGGSSVAWVMKRTVHGEIVLLDDANTRRYANNQMGGPGPELLNYPVLYSQKSGATAASTKSVYFGNWSYVGWRDAGMMNFLRDPYSYEAGIELRYQFRTVYGVLQAEAIGYGVHPSA